MVEAKRKPTDQTIKKLLAPKTRLHDFLGFRHNEHVEDFFNEVLPHKQMLAAPQQRYLIGLGSVNRDVLSWRS